MSRLRQATRQIMAYLDILSIGKSKCGQDNSWDIYCSLKNMQFINLLNPEFGLMVKFGCMVLIYSSFGPIFDHIVF